MNVNNLFPLRVLKMLQKSNLNRLEVVEDRLLIGFGRSEFWQMEGTNR